MPDGLRASRQAVERVQMGKSDQRLDQGTDDSPSSMDHVMKWHRRIWQKEDRERQDVGKKKGEFIPISSTAVW